MKSWGTGLAGFVASVALATASVAPPTAQEIWATDAIAITVDGTSTLHDWSVSSQTAAGRVQLATAAAGGAVLSIPSKSLSGGPKGLNGKMYTALKADRFPVISYELARITGFAAPLAPGVAQTWQVEGRLTVAGTTRPIVFSSQVERTPTGGLLITAETRLRMTDFGVVPPTFMGMVKTGDDVRVRVVWALRPAGAAVPST